MVAYRMAVGRVGDWRSLIVAIGQARWIGFADSIMKAFSSWRPGLHYKDFHVLQQNLLLHPHFIATRHNIATNFPFVVIGPTSCHNLVLI
jgi:hypothetical protein